MNKARFVFQVVAALLVATGCVARHPTGYDIGAWGVNFSHGESRDFISSYSYRVATADAATFVVLTNHSPWFGKDRGRVYFEQFAINGADPATFKVLGAGFSADKSSVFFQQRKLEGADPATIDISAAPFVTDRQRVYDRYALIPGAVWPVESVRVQGMLKDASGAFFVSKQRRGAGDSAETLFDTYYVSFVPCDPATFPMIGASNAQQSMDAQCAYDGADRIPLTDRASFAFLDRGWSRDVGGVFYRAERLAGADPATAEVVYSASARQHPDDYFDRMQGEYFLRDRNGCWRDAKRPVERCNADVTPVRRP